MNWRTLRPHAALITAVLVATVVLLSASSAAAAGTPAWTFEPLANTNAAPGSEYDYYFQFNNVGTEATSGKYTLTVNLPAGITATGVSTSGFPGMACEGNGPTPGELTGSSALVCTSETSLVAAVGTEVVEVLTEVSPGISPPASGRVVARARLEGGGASPVGGVLATDISTATPAFAIQAFDAASESDLQGDAFTQAGGNPFQASSYLDLSAVGSGKFFHGNISPVQPVKDILVELPSGFVGNPTQAVKCTAAQLANALSALDVRELCPPGSQIGIGYLHGSGIGPGPQKIFGPIPIFDMVTPPGVAARFGFDFAGTVVSLDARVRSGRDYGVTIESANISEGISLTGPVIKIWGIPGSSLHTPQRACPDQHMPVEGGPTCEAEIEPHAFLRNPTSCASEATGLTTTVHTDSWFVPGSRDAEGNPDLSDPAWHSASTISHLSPGYPLDPSEWGPPQGPTGCAKVPFTPSLSVQPTTNKADSPTGLNVDLRIPQRELTEPGGVAQSDLRDASVVLPAGMSVNPSAANGLGSCSAAQIGLTTPVGDRAAQFTGLPASCPDSSKVGSVKIQTPLLEHELEGSVYLAKQGENPFNSLLATYIYVDDEASGVILKLPGEVSADPSTGRLTATFSGQPQLPFEHLHLEFFGGPRAALRTPMTCGIERTEASLAGWANPGTPTHLTDDFQITAGPGGGACPKGAGEIGFGPHLSAGTQNPVAGSYSSFDLRVSREDGSQELSSLTATLPKGLIGSLKGVPYCPDQTLASISGAEGTGVAQEQHPSCPAASQVGRVTVGAGAGPNPFYTQSGHAYLAGPYKGAPLSLAVVVPAVAGPFDLGSVVVRNKLEVGLFSAQITAVSDPLPTILHGIPLDVRDIRVELDRNHFTLNPTSCDPTAIETALTSTLGSQAKPTQRFQVGGCNKLKFKPSLSLTLKGKTKRAGHPALKAVLTYPKHGAYANIAAAQVSLPHAEFLDQGNIGTVCTQAQLASATCPKASIYGKAKAWTPLLEKPLEGPVYLAVGFGYKLPALVADLDGQIRVLLKGKVDTDKQEGIRNTFEAVPDAPVEKFELNLKGGTKYGLLENSENLCKGKPKATAAFTAQNGLTETLHPVLKTECGKGKGKKGGKAGKSGSGH